MTAGLPGIGLSGLFMLLCALVLPARAAWHRPSSGARSAFWIAVVAVVLSVAVWELATVAIEALSGRSARHAILGLPTILWSLAILLFVTLAVEVLARLVPPRLTPTPPPVTDIDRSAPEDAA